MLCKLSSLQLHTTYAVPGCRSPYQETPWSLSHSKLSSPWRKSKILRASSAHNPKAYCFDQYMTGWWIAKKMFFSQQQPTDIRNSPSISASSFGEGTTLQNCFPSDFWLIHSLFIRTLEVVTVPCRTRLATHNAAFFTHMCDIHTYGQFVGYLFETRHVMSPWLQTRNIEEQSNINWIAAASKIGGYLASRQESCM